MEKHKEKHKEDREFLQKNFFRKFSLKIIRGGLIGFCMAVFMGNLLSAAYAKKWGIWLPVIRWVITPLLPLMWSSILDRDEMAFVDYNVNKKIPNPYLVGLSMGYFIVAWQWIVW